MNRLRLRNNLVEVQDFRIITHHLALSTKMSQLGHYETIHILGMCIGNVVHEQTKSRENDFIDTV